MHANDRNTNIFTRDRGHFPESHRPMEHKGGRSNLTMYLCRYLPGRVESASPMELTTSRIELTRFSPSHFSSVRRRILIVQRVVPGLS